MQASFYYASNTKEDGHNCAVLHLRRHLSHVRREERGEKAMQWKERGVDTAREAMSTTKKQE